MKKAINHNKEIDDRLNSPLRTVYSAPFTFVEFNCASERIIYNFVKALSGRIIIFKVESSDTIHNVQAKVPVKGTHLTSKDIFLQVTTISSSLVP